MISFDEYGPVEVRPRGGQSWCQTGHPARVRATYRRFHGVRHYLSAYDLQDDRLLMHGYRRKRWQEILHFLRYLRRRYPADERLYIILDNWSPHKKSEVVRWARVHNISLVYSPTNASWLNPIESIFSGIQRFVFSNSDFADHQEIALAIHKYNRWRNSHPSDATLKKIEKHKPSFVTRH
ncbi:MAG: transposase [Candidatus Latescibacterota bacterium]